MAAATTSTKTSTQEANISGKSQGKEFDMNVDLTTPEGFTAARAAWKAAGCPADHPYLTAEMPQAEVRPLVISVTDTQWSAVQAARPIMRAISDANVAAMMAVGR